MDAPVVVGVDGTSASTPAIGFAFDFADRHGTPLHAVQSHAVAGEIDDSFVGTWRQAYPEVPVRIEVIDERPAQALLEWSADAALLVVGSHGHGAAGRVLLGSVSHAALYHSACPVAVLRGPTEESC